MEIHICALKGVRITQKLWDLASRCCSTTSLENEPVKPPKCNRSTSAHCGDCILFSGYASYYCVKIGKCPTIDFAARGSWGGNMASPDVVPVCPVTANGVIDTSVVHSKDLVYACSLCISSFRGCIMFLVCSAWVCFLLLQNFKPNLVCERKKRLL